MDDTYHFPPDLYEQFVEVIPLLNKSKPDVLRFFRAAGIPESFYSDFAERLRVDAKDCNKYEITKAVLARIHERREVPDYIKMRRNLAQRVHAVEDFSGCYDDNRLKATGLVAQIRKAINVHDTFVRMDQEREAERKKHSEAAEAERLKMAQRREQFAKIKDDLYALFPMTDAQKRGKALEGVLNRLFDWAGILVSEEFTIRLENGKPYEQVDGVIEIDGLLYLVEMKWWQVPIGKSEVNDHLMRIVNRWNQVRGIIISYSGFTETAVEAGKEGYFRGATVVFFTLQELIKLIDSEGDLKGILKARINQSILAKKPVLPLD